MATRSRTISRVHESSIPFTRDVASIRCNLCTIMSVDSVESVGRIIRQIHLAIRKGPSRMGIVRSSGRGCRAWGGRFVSFRDVCARTREGFHTTCRDLRFVVNWACNIFGGLLLSAGVTRGARPSGTERSRTRPNTRHLSDGRADLRYVSDSVCLGKPSPLTIPLTCSEKLHPSIAYLRTVSRLVSLRKWQSVLRLS